MLTIQSATSSLLKGLDYQSACLSQAEVIFCVAIEWVLFCCVHTDETAAPINFLGLSPSLSRLRDAACGCKTRCGAPYWYAVRCLFLCGQVCSLDCSKKKGRRKKKKRRESVLLSAVYLSELIQVDVPLCLFPSACLRVCLNVCVCR